METDHSKICQLLIEKGELKQQIYSSTLESMELFKECAKEFEDYYKPIEKNQIRKSIIKRALSPAIKSSLIWFSIKEHSVIK